MKGNKVRVLDGSYSLEITPNGFQHALLGLMTNTVFTVLDSNQKLPSNDDMHDMGYSKKRQVNDAIIQSPDGRIFYTQQRFLETVELAGKQKIPKVVFIPKKIIIEEKVIIEDTKKSFIDLWHKLVVGNAIIP